MNISVHKWGSGWAVIGDAGCFEWAHVEKLPVDELTLRKAGHRHASDQFYRDAVNYLRDWRPS